MLKFLKGKKTLLVSFCGLVYGIYVQDFEIVLASLALAGLRDALPR